MNCIRIYTRCTRWSWKFWKIIPTNKRESCCICRSYLTILITVLNSYFEVNDTFLCLQKTNPRNQLAEEKWTDPGGGKVKKSRREVRLFWHFWRAIIRSQVYCTLIASSPVNIFLAVQESSYVWSHNFIFVACSNYNKTTKGAVVYYLEGGLVRVQEKTSTPPLATRGKV